MKIEINDTIAAISTPLGEGGIGIVRLSGPKAIDIIRKIFIPVSKKNISKSSGFTLHYGYIYEKKIKIEEVLVSIMKAPKSYTREDVVEISGHGGILPLRKILELCLENGARIADPGEFTKRAFLNGRIDLVQAEAVSQIIRAKTDKALNCAINQLSGKLSEKIKRLKNELIDLLAYLEASLDYSDEDIEFLSSNEILKRVNRIQKNLSLLIATFNKGKIIQEGVKTSIVGKPNVGKSSLLNALLNTEKAIVTPIPGTTRDIIEDYVNIKGIPLNIMDTAGIRKVKNTVEKIGVERSKESIKKSDLILFIVDISQPLDKEDFFIYEFIKENLDNKKLILIGNKVDLVQKVSDEKLKEMSSTYVKISATKEIGIDKLEEIVFSLFISGEIDLSSEVLVTSLRHKDALIKANQSLKRSIEAINNNHSEEFIALDLRCALNSLGEIIGEVATEDILDRVFSNFCVGK